MRIPVIGVTPHYEPDNNKLCIASMYLEAILDAGGVPLLLPLKANEEALKTAVSVCDGFLFTGGPDIDPFRFGEETLEECDVVYPDRDQMEETIFNLVIGTGKPVFGICRGIQVLNVFFGGTLFQDIAAQFQRKLNLCHSQKSGRTVLSHSVTIERDSLLYDILQEDTLMVNSFHHQGIKDVAPELNVAARSRDGLVEAVYLRDHPFFLAVQWHPEHLFRVNEGAKKLFTAFVDASR